MSDILAHAKARTYERARDASFVLTKLYALNRERGSWIHGHLDLTNIGVFGHSRGGLAAAQACFLDKRFKACLNMDGGTLGRPFYPDASTGYASQSFMWFQRLHDKPSNEQLSTWKMNRRQSDENLDRIQSRVNSLLRGLKLTIYRVTISYATHLSFSDTPLVSRAADLEVLAARRRRMRIIRTYVVAFFDRHLRSSKVDLFNGPSGDFPEILFEDFSSATK